ncbi:MAG: hypothetical protein K1Y02_14055 [Candidatus Hydrogenedentes bacterium]|nr:hypothetical protein [Candidatus Hydrogenedentota bacterium]
MIQINLLPHHLRPIKRSALPYVLCAALFVLVVLGIGVSFVSTQAAIASIKGDLAEHKAEMEKLQPIVDESNELETLKIQLADKLMTIDEIAKERIIWSRQLWNLARLTPDNVWYSEVEVTTKAYQVPEPVLDPQTGKPKINPQTKLPETKMKTVNRPILRVSGYVVEAADGSQDVSPLTDALTTDPEFTSLFQLDSPSFQNTEFEDFPVKKFTLEFLIATGGQQQ